MDAPLRASHTAIGYTDEAIELYLARKLTLVDAQARRRASSSRLSSLPFDEAVDMVRDGRITDVKTVAAILWVEGVPALAAPAKRRIAAN